MTAPKLHRNVVALGLVSLLTDLSSEMIYPLLPVFLTATLAAGPAVLGLIEGVAETTASLLKLFSGVWSDRSGRKKPLVLAGYGLSTLVRPLVGFATGWGHVLAVRFCDRIGKGVRTSPRDALVAAYVPPAQRGKAFGLQRSMDHLGAVLGPVAAFLLLAGGISLRSVFLLSIVPGLAAVAVLAFLVRDAPAADVRSPHGDRAARRRTFAGVPPVPAPRRPVHPRERERRLPHPPGRGFRSARAVRPAAVGGVPRREIVPLGPRGSPLRPDPKEVAGGGRLVRVRRLLRGLLRRARRGRDGRRLPAVRAVRGGVRGRRAGDGGRLRPGRERGTAFGWFHLVTGICALPASVLFGLLWSAYGAPAAFGVGAGFALLAAALLLLLRPEKYERIR